MTEETFSIFGGGTWGATLACLLHEKWGRTSLWEYDARVVEELNATRTPAKLPALRIPDAVAITNDIAQAAAASRNWVVVVPSHGIRALAHNLKDAFDADPPETITVCTKGIEADTSLTMTQVIESELGGEAASRLVALSGPSHAEEVSRGVPTTVVSAARDEALAHRVQKAFNTECFRVYTCADPLGVELGAALKNVIAIAAGICDGMGFGDNTRAALMTRGLAEMTRLGVKMGALRETFAGLAGMGDLIVTAGSRHSRNRNFGELLGRGTPIEDARKQIGMEIEGFYAARSTQSLSKKFDVDLPISTEVYKALYEGKSLDLAVKNLLSRAPKPEIWG